MKAKLYIFVIITVTMFGCQRSSPFKDFVSQKGRFSVLMPGVPAEHTETLNSAVGPLELHGFTVEHKDTVHIVEYVDYPDDKIKKVDPRDFFDACRDGVVAHVQGVILIELLITLDEYPGRELRVECETEGIDSIMQFRMFLVDNRLYQIMTISSKDDAFFVGARDFLDSFKLQK